MQYIYCMSFRLALILAVIVAVPSLASTNAEEEVVSDGRWQLLGVADGLIPPEPPAAKIDSSLLAAYAGEYEWAPTLISKIEPKGDRLLEHFGGGDPITFIELGATDRIVRKVK